MIKKGSCLVCQECNAIAFIAIADIQVDSPLMSNNVITPVGSCRKGDVIRCFNCDLVMGLHLAKPQLWVQDVENIF